MGNSILAMCLGYRSTASQVAAALGTTLGVLMGESVPHGGASTVHEYLLSDALTDLIVASTGLSGVLTTVMARGTNSSGITAIKKHSDDCKFTVCTYD